MSLAETTLARVNRFREILAKRGLDAALIRNNADLRWLTGAERVFDDEVAHSAYITQESLYLHTDSRYFNSFVERLGKDSIWTLDEEMVGQSAWAAAKIEQTGAHFVAVEDTVTLGYFDSLQSDLLARGLAVNIARLHGDIADLRKIKDAQEIELMQRAQDITDAAYEHICGFIKPGQTEQEIRIELENFMFSQGADALSFDTIIAAGPNGANPHAQPGEYKVQMGDMIVMDYGAGYRDYHSDMTRTVVVGEPSEEQQKVYDVVRKAHEECAKAARAGVIGASIHQLAIDIISEAGYGDYFKHGLGHGVGLEIHEQPNFSLRYNKEIPAGSVVTIEPGIYLPQKFGIRLEDFGLVDEEGYKPFTKSSHDLRVVGI